MKALIALAMASVIALTACGGPQAAGKTGSTVTATLSDSKITLDRTTVPTGSITFVVKNIGTITHEVVVLKTDLAADQIPADAEEPGKVSEDGSQGESGDLEKGATSTFTLDLQPGKYVLMCNQIGHYAMGMHIPFTVTK